jgi:hypothetical protein
VPAEGGERGAAVVRGVAVMEEEARYGSSVPGGSGTRISAAP